MKKKKLPKLSKAILNGISKYPYQCTGIFICAGEQEACAVGGALGYYNLWPSALYEEAIQWQDAMTKFQEEYGISIWDANDGEDGLGGLDRETIAGMLIAINE